MHKKIIFLAAAIMLLPLFAGYCQIEEPEIVWEQYVGHDISEAQFSPDGTIIAHRDPNNGQVDIRDAATGELLNKIYSANGRVILRFDIFPDGQRIAVSSYNNGPVVYILDMNSGDVLDSIIYDTEKELNWRSRASKVVISPDGRYIAFTVHLPHVVPDSLYINQIVVWDIEESKIIRVFDRGNEKSIGVVDFSKDGRYLVIGSRDKGNIDHIKILTYPDLVEFQEISFSIDYWDISISPNGSMLATAGGSGYIRIWDIESGEMVFKEPGGGPWSIIAFSKDSKYLVSYVGNNLEIWNIQNNIKVKIYEKCGFWKYSEPISPDGDFMIIGRYDPWHIYLLEEDWDFTSVEGDEIIEQTILYPNPTDNKVEIEFNVSSFSNVAIKIIDNEGKNIDNIFNGQLNPGEHQFYWDSSNYPSGNYYCRIETDNYIKTYKIIVNK